MSRNRRAGGKRRLQKPTDIQIKQTPTHIALTAAKIEAAAAHILATTSGPKTKQGVLDLNNIIPRKPKAVTPDNTGVVYQLNAANKKRG